MEAALVFGKFYKIGSGDLGGHWFHFLDSVAHVGQFRQWRSRRFKSRSSKRDKDRRLAYFLNVHNIYAIEPPRQEIGFVLSNFGTVNLNDRRIGAF